MKKSQFHIVRADKAGVFICRIVSKVGDTYTVSNARRLYRWYGALDVSMIAKDGVANIEECKFSVQMEDDDLSTIHNVIESHPVSEKALQIINSVPVWKKN
jgi:hypothetical protein